MFDFSKKTAIVYNKDVAQSYELALIIKEKIKNSQIFPISSLEKDVDFAIIIGGDGTLLKAARFFSEYDIPIIAFNTGRLGYLAQAKPEEVDLVLEKLNSKDYEIEKNCCTDRGCGDGSFSGCLRRQEGQRRGGCSGR